MIFKVIVIIYCLVGLAYNILLIPRENKLIYEQNQFIINRYKRLDELMDRVERLLDEEVKE